MSYRFLDSGEGDMRVRRTRTHLKEALLQMVAERPVAKISVTELSERAEVNRKTFYLHYSGIGDMLLEIADDIVRTLAAKFTGELEADVYTLYQFLDTDEEGLKRLLTETDYVAFQERLYDGVFTHGAFEKITEESRYPDITAGYLHSVIGIFYSYMDRKNEATNLKKLARNATKLVLLGITGGGYRVNGDHSFRYSWGGGFCEAA